jgi:fumarate hydratase class II
MKIARRDPTDENPNDQVPKSQTSSNDQIPSLKVLRCHRAAAQTFFWILVIGIRDLLTL